MLSLDQCLLRGVFKAAFPAGLAGYIAQSRCGRWPRWVLSRKLAARDSNKVVKDCPGEGGQGQLREGHNQGPVCCSHSLQQCSPTGELLVCLEWQQCGWRRQTTGESFLKAMSLLQKHLLLLCHFRHASRMVSNKTAIIDYKKAPI